MSKFEHKFLLLIEKNLFFISAIIITFLGVLLRLTGFHLESGDLTAFVLPWYKELKEAGGLNGLSTYNGDYNAPYVFLLAILTYLPIKPIWSIKLLSCMFDFIGAIFSALIVSNFYNAENKKMISLITYATILFCPVVFLNSSYWGQTDFIYVTFLLISIFFLIKKKYTYVMIAFGLALSFKLQAVFILPFLLIYYMKNKEFSILRFLLVPLTLIVTGLPNFFWGHKSIFHFFTVYLNQSHTNGLLSYYYPNIWFWFPQTELIPFPKVAILVTILLIGIMAILIIGNKKIAILSSKDIITFALWSAMTCVIFLPYMHERYGFFVEIASIIYVFIFKKHWWIAIVLNTISLFTYIDYLYSISYYNYTDMAILNFSTYIAFSLITVKQLYNKSNSAKNTFNQIPE